MLRWCDEGVWDPFRVVGLEDDGGDGKGGQEVIQVSPTSYNPDPVIWVIEKINGF